MEDDMRGLYQDNGWAQVTDGHSNLPIPRDRYEANGYLPPFDELPTKEKYEAENA
jgi:hypothetical protein